MESLRKTWLLWTALIAIGIGYLALGAGRLTVGPLLLVAGYCLMLPFYLWRSFQGSVGE